MKAVNTLLPAFVVLALVVAVAKVAAVMLLVLITIAFIMRPRQTMGCMTSLILLALLGRYPIAALTLLSTLIIVRFAYRRPNNS